jgi:hypothetical protein
VATLFAAALAIPDLACATVVDSMLMKIALDWTLGNSLEGFNDTRQI